MLHVSQEMQRCIHQCLGCYQVCTATAMNHCLELGGKHAEKNHFTLMMSCAEICRTAAQFMLMNSPHHHHICRECAEICDECADDCERLGGMEECVESCRKCAEHCRHMAEAGAAATAPG
jgi:hypothetical protein